MFKCILIPTDGSELSGRAVKLGVEMARTCQARIHALHVIPPFQHVFYMADLLLPSEAAYVEQATSEGRHYLEQAEAAAKAAGVACETTLVTDRDPSHAILECAGSKGCDLIVMASHGWRGMNRLLLGSETHKVLLQSQVAVLVCR